MICNSEIGNRGRLGNVLFQYAAMRGLAELNGSVAILPSDINERDHHGQQCLLRYFKIDPIYVSVNTISQICTNYFYDGENPRIFKPEFLTLPKNTNLIGHYENIKYFEHIEDEIREEFQLCESIKETGRNKLNDFLSGYPKDTQIIGIHIRLGDGIDTYDPEYKESWMDEYLKNAISMFDDIENKIFICFTGGARYNGDVSENSEIEYCRIYLGQYIKDHLYFSCGNLSIVDFSMLTQVNHIIVLVFSTFIWWAGFTNKKGGKVIVPRNAKFAVGTEYWHRLFVQL